MGNDVVNAPQALLKLKKRTGGLQYWISPTEAGLITSAVGGEIPLSTSILVPGPAPETSFRVTADYTVPPGVGFEMTLAVDGGAPVTVVGIASDRTRTGEAIARFCALIEEEAGVDVSFSGGDNISETDLHITAKGLDVEITAFGTGFPDPGNVEIFKADATQSIQGYLKCTGYFQPGDVATIDWTSTPSGPFQTSTTFTESVTPEEAAVILANSINGDPLAYADNLASGYPDRLRFFAEVPETALNCDAVNIT